MEVDGRKIVIITKDDQGKPDLAKSALAEAYEDDGVDIAVGTTSSAAAIAMLPVAEEHKKILIVEPAVADQITGDKWNRYIFRTARNSIAGRDLERDRDRQAGRAYRDAGAGLRLRPRRRRRVQGGARQDRGDARRRGIRAGQHHRFHRARAAPVRRAEGQAGQKLIWIVWAGGGNPLDKLADLDPGRYGIELSTGGNILPALAAYKRFPGLEGAAYYYYEIPKNPVNDWLVAEHEKRFNAPPDFFTAGGFAAAMAIVDRGREGEIDRYAKS